MSAELPSTEQIFTETSRLVPLYFAVVLFIMLHRVALPLYSVSKFAIIQKNTAEQYFPVVLLFNMTIVRGSFDF